MESNNDDNNSKCVAISQQYNGSWSNSICTQKFSFLCSYIAPTNSPTKTPTKRPTMNPTKFLIKYIIGDTAMTWNEAEKYCLSQQSHLVTITDASVNDQVKTLCRLNYDALPSRGCWIGLSYDDSTSLWEWKDGSLSLIHI